MKYKDVWDDITQKMGYWVDLNNPYVTFENNYIESVWYLLQQLYKKDFLYKGKKITYQAPFDKCDRVEDYKVAWAHFEKVFRS